MNQFLVTGTLKAVDKEFVSLEIMANGILKIVNFYGHNIQLSDRQLGNCIGLVGKVESHVLNNISALKLVIDTITFNYKIDNHNVYMNSIHVIAFADEATITIPDHSNNVHIQFSSGSLDSIIFSPAEKIDLQVNTPDVSKFPCSGVFGFIDLDDNNELQFVYESAHCFITDFDINIESERG